jgi:hypothetical protein
VVGRELVEGLKEVKVEIEFEKRIGGKQSKDFKESKFRE